MKAIEAIVVAIIVIFVMAVIVSLLNRDGSEGEGFWKLKERDVTHILCFGVAGAFMVLIASSVWVHIESVFWASIVRTLPWIVMIIAMWVYADRRLASNDDDDEDDGDDVVHYPWDEEGDIKWPWDE